MGTQSTPATPVLPAARIIPFPQSRIVRLRRAPRRTAQQQADDDMFGEGFKLALDLVAKMQRGLR